MNGFEKSEYRTIYLYGQIPVSYKKNKKRYLNRIFLLTYLEFPVNYIKSELNST